MPGVTMKIIGAASCRVFALLATALLGDGCANHPLKLAVPRPVTDAQIIERFHREIPELMTKYDIPGIAIAVIDRQSVLWAEGFGSTDRSGGIPVTPGTPFSVQSTSKTITATAILLAVQDGLLDLDAPIRRYFPEFSIRSRFDADPASQITLRHLLSHTAGLTHEAPVGNNFAPESPSFDAHVASIMRTWLRFPVGDRYSYSNLGIDLAGYALERASGKPFATYVTERLLKPLGMNDSTFDPVLIQQRRDRAIGHKKSYANVPVPIPMIPSGGLYTSVADLAKFVRFHLNRGTGDSGRILRERLLSEMYRIPSPVDGQEEGYALGVGLRRHDGRSYFTHGGGGFGFLSDMLWYPDPGIGIVVLTNSADHPLQGDLALRILDAFLARRKSSSSPIRKESAATVASAPVSRFLGTYAGRSGLIRVEERDSEVRFVSGKESFPLRPLSSTEAMLILPDHSVKYRFQFSAMGRPSKMMKVKDGETWDYNDSPSDGPGPDLASWASFVGEYQTSMWGQRADKVRGERKNGYLYLDDLRLAEYQPGLFFTCSGEAVDFRKDPATFANIALSRIGP